jgi:hypothetical protein
MDRSSFQKHQGSGRRAQGLGSSGHRISFLAGLKRAASLINLNGRTSYNHTATQQPLDQAKMLIPSFKRVTRAGTIGVST